MGSTKTLKGRFMNYEKSMLEKLNMPTRKDVEEELLKSLFINKGVIREFGANEKVVNEIANVFNLSEEQRTAYLETIYRKENRVKRSYLWHRLLFRAADSLAKQKLVSRPTQTFSLTNQKEWMLTEEGYDHTLRVLNLPLRQKEILQIKSYEVQKIVNNFLRSERSENYIPFERKKSIRTTREYKLRNRAFKQVVREVYDYRCAICGLKIYSPNTLNWEIEAAHIVPHKDNGKDDILNGIALCHLHHWAFDVGWFTLKDNLTILASEKIKNLPTDFGLLGNYDFIRQLKNSNQRISLPKEKAVHPHPNAIKWHRENIFNREGI